MKKNFLKIGFFLIFSWLLISPSLAKANGLLEITFEKTPLFQARNFLPGDSLSSWLRAKNNSNQSLSIYLWANNVSDPANFGSVLNLKIKEGANFLYENSLSHFFSQSAIFLSQLSAGQEKQYDLALSFDILAGNQYQGKSLQFDLLIGSTWPGQGGQPSGGVTVAVQAGGPGPSLEIFNLQVKDITETSATIFWETNFRATSQLIYSPEEKSHIFEPDNPPLYGYSNLFPDPEDSFKVIYHSVLLQNLTPCSSYYFRAISRYLETAISQEETFTTLCPGGVGQEEEKKKEEEVPEEAGATPPSEAPKVLPKEKPVTEKEIFPEKELPKEKELAEGGIEIPIKELLGEEEKEKTFLANLLASIGQIFKGLSCLPWWLIFLLAVFPLAMVWGGWQKIKKEQFSKARDFFKRETISWLSWFFILLILAFLPYFLFRLCFEIWSFLLLILATIFLCYFFQKKEKKLISQFNFSDFKTSPFIAKNETGIETKLHRKIKGFLSFPQVLIKKGLTRFLL